MWIDIVSVVIRALSFILVLQAAGIAFFVAIFGRRLVVDVGIIRLGKFSAWSGIALVTMHQLLDAGRMAGELSGVFDASLQYFAFTTSSARANGLRVVGLLVLATALSTGKNTMAVMAGALICVSFIFTGHTSVHAQRWLLAPLLWMHLVVVAFWFGALLPLVMITQRETAAITAEIIVAFSRIAIWIVPVIALAGIAIAWALLPALSALFEPYGMLLLVKLLGFSLLMVLAALNKWRLGPAIAAGEARAMLAFRRSVLAEFVLICLVLGATAAMTGLFSPESA